MCETENDKPLSFGEIAVQPIAGHIQGISGALHPRKSRVETFGDRRFFVIALHRLLLQVSIFHRNATNIALPMRKENRKKRDFDAVDTYRRGKPIGNR